MCLRSKGISISREKCIRSNAVVDILETRNRFEIFGNENTSTLPLSEPQDKKISTPVLNWVKAKVKAKRRKPKHQTYNMRLISSSQTTNIRVVRCNMCFVSHFPFSKICAKSKIQMSRIPSAKQNLLCDFLLRLEGASKEGFKNTDLPMANPKRLQGGVKHGSIPLMIKQAIESARKHGIDLVPGVRNNADGNCSFESVLNNINYRDCFENKLTKHPNAYRLEWVTALENESLKNPDIAAGYSEEEKRENWALLKCPGVYQVPYFGDFIMHGIANGCRKNILIFNTSPEASDPIYVIAASRFGGNADSDIPVILAYNQIHYESLHPLSAEDIDKTKLLINEYVSGNYTFQKRDIPHLIDFSRERNSDINRLYSSCAVTETEKVLDKGRSSKIVPKSDAKKK